LSVAYSKKIIKSATISTSLDKLIMGYRSFHIVFLIIISHSISLVSCGQTNEKTVVPMKSSTAKARLDSTQIETFLVLFPKLVKYQDQLHAFYHKRGFTYAWYQDGKLIEQATNLQNRLINLKEDGVYKILYYSDKMDSLIQEEHGAIVPNIKLELLLTSEYFVFSNLVWEGMSSTVRQDNDWFLPRKKLSYELYLDSLLQTSNIGSPKLKEPVYRQYELLKENLRKYRALDIKNVWIPITSISQVKLRLVQLEDLSQNYIDTINDENFKTALRSFQKRHGLQSNGALDKATLIELNVPLKSRIKQIIVNMERTRWLPVSTIGNYVAVNIPEFQMHVYDADSLLWSSNAMVGREANATTLFYGEINQVVFSPYWNVPESIVRKEILPGIRKDQGYLIKHNMVILGQRNGLPIVRQKPGASNALGRVKFLFPNSYSIYLHDTPGKSLFGETERAFSHGCIRIQNPEKLAALLLKNDPKWNENSIYNAMHSGREKIVSTTGKVPVYIVYMTAFIDRQNKLNFRKDIYKLDARLASTIISGDGSY
jgi:murein L,D-transpeptidase YcbB/YkuD